MTREAADCGQVTKRSGGSMKVRQRIQPDWIRALLRDSQEYWTRITRSALFKNIATGALSADRVRFAIKNFYPVIESFPQYLGLMLGKAPQGHSRAAVMARQWLLENLHVEQRHAAWFVDLAAGFGLSRSNFLNPIVPPPEMDAINNYLWRVCTQGTFVECLGAVNFAMEGPTAEWTRLTKQGLRLYDGREGVQFSADTMTWIDAHAVYDDDHVEGALRLMGLLAKTKAEQQSSAAAALRSLQYYAMAIESCYQLSERAPISFPTAPCPNNSEKIRRMS
jgi:pyrroloquinoline quinone (PQQ) biosynthesis protein C